jgi:hypothetical protein
MSQDAEDRSESLRHEYTEACSYHRHYSALRFVVFTVYFAVTGGIATAAFGLTEIQADDLNLFLWARIAGCVITVAFFLFEFLCEKYASYYADTVRKLAAELGYTRTTRTETRLRALHVTFPLYFLFLGFWLFALISLFGVC